MQDKEFAAILQEEPMQPLALVPLTEEEQVCHPENTMHLPPNVELLQLIVWYLMLHLGSTVKPVLVDKCGCELTFLTFLPFALSVLSRQRNFSMSVNSVAVLRLMGKGVSGVAPAGVARGRGATRGGRGKNYLLKPSPSRPLEEKQQQIK